MLQAPKKIETKDEVSKTQKVLASKPVLNPSATQKILNKSDGGSVHDKINSRASRMANLVHHYDPRVSYNTSDEKESRRVSWSSKSVEIASKAMSEGYPLRNSPFFKNNTLLRDSNLYYMYKREEKLEIAKSKIDIIHFAKTYCQLMTSSGRRMPIKLRGYQKRILISIQKNPYTIILSGRQVGKTTTTAIAILWFVCFHPEYTVALLGDKAGTAIENLDKIKEIYYNLPFFMKPGVLAWNVKTVVFDNKSKIITGSCKKSAIVGKTINLLYIDELAIPLPHQSRSVVEYAMPAMETFVREGKGKVVFSSTPNGENIFKEIWIKAVRKVNSFVPIKIPWWEVPDRDLKWKMETLAQYGIDAFNEQFNCIFLSSSSSFYSQNVVEQIERRLKSYKRYETDNEAINKCLWRVMDETLTGAEPEPCNYLYFRKDIDVNSLKDEHIVMQLDIAEGMGDDHDFTVANIFRLVDGRDTEGGSSPKAHNKREAIKRALNKWSNDHDFSNQDINIADDVRLEQIGLFHTNMVSIPTFAMFMRVISHELFNPDALRINPEVNKYGGHFKTLLLSERFPEYEIELSTIGKTIWNDKTVDGVTITPKSKPLYVRQSKTLLETSKIILNENRTVDEMKYFGKVKNSYGALEGHHDDIMMTVVGLSAYVDKENNDWLDFCESFIAAKDGTNTRGDLDSIYEEFTQQPSTFGIFGAGENGNAVKSTPLRRRVKSNILTEDMLNASGEAW